MAEAAVRDPWRSATAAAVAATVVAGSALAAQAPAVAWPGAAVERMPWCDFAQHAQGLAATAVALDPVFRTPGPQPCAALEAIAANPKAAHQERVKGMAALFAGPDGPALARLALAATDPVRLASALDAAATVAVGHPRLAGLVLPHLAHPDAEVAERTVDLLFATGCDAPALYALDGLRHPAGRVQEQTVRHVIAAAVQRPDLGLVGRLLAWLELPGGDRIVKVRAVRALGAIAWLPATATLQRLVDAKDPLLAGEALVALARVAPIAAEPKLQPWARDRSPLRRAAAVRAAADVLAVDPKGARKFLEPLLKDKAALPDPATGGPTTVAALARQALACVEMGEPLPELQQQPRP